jgi:hypothetical protein
MAKAKCPALRPIAVTRYQRPVVWASTRRLWHSIPPSCRAVSKPKVGASPGSGKSLSMVLGTCATRMPPAASATAAALVAVSSPPMEMMACAPSCLRAATTRARSSFFFVGLARLVNRMLPPRVSMPATSAAVRAQTSDVSPAMSRK